MTSTIICPQCRQPFEVRWQVEKRRFCSVDCKNYAGASESTRQKMRNVVRARGETHPSWIGGRRQLRDGYIRVAAPEHPHRISNNTVLEHRLVMERMIGRLLLDTEVVHHINGKKDDNRPENLELFATHSDHLKHHGEIGKPPYYNPLNTATHRQCSLCKTVKPLTYEYFPMDKSSKYGFDYRCRECSKARWTRG